MAVCVILLTMRSNHNTKWGKITYGREEHLKIMSIDPLLFKYYDSYTIKYFIN